MCAPSGRSQRLMMIEQAKAAEKNKPAPMAPIPVRADEERRQVTTGAIQDLRKMTGPSATMFTGGMGDRGYGAASGGASTMFGI